MKAGDQIAVVVDIRTRGCVPSLIGDMVKIVSNRIRATGNPLVVNKYDRSRLSKLPKRDHAIPVPVARTKNGFTYKARRQAHEGERARRARDSYCGMDQLD